MKIMYVVEWRFTGDWEFSAAFVDPREAIDYAVSLNGAFPSDYVRVVKRKVSIDDEVISKVEIDKAAQ